MELLINKIIKEVNKKLKYNQTHCDKYNRTFVITGKQSDRHSAMQYHERVMMLQDIKKLLFKYR